MIRSLFILTEKGDIIIEKHWRGFLNRSIIDQFVNEINKYDSPQELPPIIATSKFYLVHFFAGDLFFVCPVQGDVPPLLITDFLVRLVEIFKEYFGSVTETEMKNNFVTVYQLLDEVMDSGVPFTTELNILKEMVPPPSLLSWPKEKKLELPEELASTVPWRHSMKYTTNEIFFDIVEEFDSVVDINGLVITSSIFGSVNVQCKLSGMPDLTLHWSNPRLFDDASFHPCVRYHRYEMDRVVSFIPPDGNFCLMKYRIYQPIQPPIYCKPSITFHETGARLNVMVGPKNAGDKVIEDVLITIPFPKTVATVNLEALIGSTNWDDQTKLFKWFIPKIPKDKTPMLEGSVSLVPGAHPPECNPTVRVGFTVPMFCASGIKVESLALHNESYKPYKGVKFVTRSGKFQVRC